MPSDEPVCRTVGSRVHVFRVRVKASWEGGPSIARGALELCTQPAVREKQQSITAARGHGVLLVDIGYCKRRRESEGT